ncbi:MAG: hypothetical protein AAF449_20220 [Myxococcota bacterium]
MLGDEFFSMTGRIGCLPLLLSARSWYIAAMRYDRLRWLLPQIGIGYVALGLVATAVPGFEIFPFFCWFLFPVTPNVETRYELIVTAMGGRSLPVPTEYQSLDVVEDPMAMDLWIAVQDLGKALAIDDQPRVDMLRSRIELNFLPAPNRYRIERVTFDPLERWHDGTVKERASIAAFTSSTGVSRIPWTYAP